MIKVSNLDVWGFEHAIRGMRNPLNSWDKSDSEIKVVHVDQFSLEETKDFVIGKNDLDLMKRLYKAGTEHRKYLRQIFVSLDITAPLYWWKEFDTYKVGTVSNSCSTMHKIASKEFELNDFSYDNLYFDVTLPYNPSQVLRYTITALNYWRQQYLDTKDKGDWWQLIQLLPSSYNQKRTITMNYENVISIIKQRKNHKLDEWNDLVDYFIANLPYIREIIDYEDEM